MYFEAITNEKKFKIDVVETRTHWKISMQQEGSDWIHYDVSKSDYKRSESYFSFLFKGVSYLIDVVGKDTDYTVFTRNSFRAVKIFNDEMLLHESLKRGGSLGLNKELCSGMPGKIIEILVKEGDIVGANQPLVIMEAMKMENEMRSTMPVKIKEICVKQGSSVEAGEVLIKFEEPS